ncbi:MAG TPA: antitermination protein NusG, partial [Gammaproteobacteria bacterium]|nr:antitermination protein NusG [Gammaproteobacteria bacterium]
GYMTRILTGGLMGTFMWANVWFVIWPAQQVVIRSAEQVAGGGEPIPEAAARGGKAGMASRTNTLLSLPMLYFMVASIHGTQASGGVWGGEMSTTALVIGLAIVVLIEANAIWGKMMNAIQSVSAVITSSLILTVIMAGVVHYA